MKYCRYCTQPVRKDAPGWAAVIPQKIVSLEPNETYVYVCRARVGDGKYGDQIEHKPGGSFMQYLQQIAAII